MRHMSFALTEDQILSRTKTVTRRVGWSTLRPGTLLQPVRKAQGIPKGGTVEKIGGPIRVLSVRREWVRELIDEPYGRAEAAREGFPEWTGAQFADYLRDQVPVTRNVPVTRIEFEYTR